MTHGLPVLLWFYRALGRGSRLYQCIMSPLALELIAEIRLVPCTGDQTQMCGQSPYLPEGKC